MKRTLAVLALALLIAIPASADVFDEAGLLSRSEVAFLTELSGEIADRYDIDVVLLTVPGTDGQEVRYFAADYYDYNGYQDGVLFMLSMEERDWYMLNTGSMIDAISERKIAKIGENAVSRFSDGDYAGGFERVLRDIDEHLARGGKPPTIAESMAATAGYIPFLILGGALLAFFVMLFMKSGMKLTRPKPDAGDYVREDSLALHEQRDVFLYRTRTVRAIESESGNSGGTFTSSSGTTHSGGGGKF